MHLEIPNLRRFRASQSAFPSLLLHSLALFESGSSCLLSVYLSICLRACQSISALLCSALSLSLCVSLRRSPSESGLPALCTVLVAAVGTVALRARGYFISRCRVARSQAALCLFCAVVAARRVSLNCEP